MDPKYEEYASRWLLGLAPGYTNQDFASLQYEHVPRPVYPFDGVTELGIGTRVLVG